MSSARTSSPRLDPTISGSASGDDDLPLPSLVRPVRLTSSNSLELSRYLGHLVLGLLLLVLGLRAVPVGLQAPSVGPLVSPSPVATRRSVSLAQGHRLSRIRYLERGVAPFTLRVVRDTLPLVEPQRTVRTSVSTYRVQAGDTVLDIAHKFGLKGSSVLWANDKLDDNPDFLRVGQELYILPVDGAYHAVAKGETLETIAIRYEVESSAITEYAQNRLEPPYALEPGQRLIIPGGVKPYVPRRVFAYTGPVPEGANKGTGSFVWPMTGYITQRFWDGHRAIDIGAPAGAPIVSSDSGYVAIAQWSDVGYGRMVIIDHGNGFQTLYAHMQAYYVEVGQSVGKGQAIGQCGSTGNTTGPHLHFEIIKQGVGRNPLIYLP